MNLDTLPSDSSEEEIRDSGSSFHSLVVGAVIYIFHILENKDHYQGEELLYINMYAPIHIGRSMPTAATLVFPYLHHYHSGKILYGRLRECHNKIT